MLWWGVNVPFGVLLGLAGNLIACNAGVYNGTFRMFLNVWYSKNVFDSMSHLSFNLSREKIIFTSQVQTKASEKF